MKLINGRRVRLDTEYKRYKILKYREAGLTVKEVAEASGISFRMVERHLEIMRSDHGCANDIQLIAKAIRSKVI